MKIWLVNTHKNFVYKYLDNYDVYSKKFLDMQVLNWKQSTFALACVIFLKHKDTYLLRKCKTLYKKNIYLQRIFLFTILLVILRIVSDTVLKK